MEASPKKDRAIRLSCVLRESLPSNEDTAWIVETSQHSSLLALESLMMPYATFEGADGDISDGLKRIPGRALHPVLIARHMLQLATCLHHLQANVHGDMKASVQSPRDMMERLADTAINLVTTNDELLGSIEGLQCIMIEGIYHVNRGNLRRSWVTCRRALTIAQLMGLNRSANQAQYVVLDPKTRYNPQHMWFRMVALERHLCLMMGLPQGSLDRSMTADMAFAGDTPMGRLERLHCVLASRILERNESAPGPDDTTLTRDLDLDLQKAARSLPSKWWLPPSLIVDATESQALFWDARRLFAHVFHYSLLLQLHLPYMLHFTSNQGACDYSRITCVNASREVISRFITLRSSNRIALDCRTIDFFALMAAMTLLIAHLEGHRLGVGNLLAHQYLSDRAMTEQVQDCMEELHRLNADALSAQSANLLRRLLIMEADAMGAPALDRHIASCAQDQDDHINVGVSTPYYKIIKIAREGMSPSVMPNHGSIGFDDSGQPQASTDTLQGPALPSGSLQYDCSSASAATSGDSAFQGVDLAFFENLMRTSGGDDSLDWIFGTEASAADKP